MPLLAPRRLLLFSLSFFAAIGILHILLRHLRYQTEFIMHQYWPLSIFIPKLPAWQDVLTVIAIACFTLVLIKIHQMKKPIYTILPILWLLIIATNLLQGFYQGFHLPTTSDNPFDSSYYQDARLINNPINFIKNYVTLQPHLGYHSRVHPPLPVLFHYGLNHITTNPIIHSLIISLISLVSVWIVYKFSAQYTNRTNATLTATIYGLLPAYQIYALASIDALIATVFIATLFSYTFFGKKSLTHLLLLISALFTFGYIWLIPVLYVVTLITRKNVFKDFGLLIVTNVLLLFLVQLLFGYNYAQSFKLAVSFENTHFFLDSAYALFSYLATRIQDILEPILFLGPIITLLIFKAIYWLNLKPVKLMRNLVTATPINIPKTHTPGYIALAGLISFIGFIMTGAYYTGETARAALYLIPTLSIALAPYLDTFHLKENHRQLIIISIIIQTTIMQLFGHYSW